jgi:hypothetical protein
MDLHRFHPVFLTTPRGGYVIPQDVDNVRDAETTGIAIGTIGIGTD